MSEGWEIAGVVAEGVAALGTLAAVVAALILARRQNAARLSVTTAISHLVTPGLPGSEEGPFLSIRAVNSGLRDVLVTSIGWQVGRVRPKHFVQLPSHYPQSAPLPKKLAPSDEALFLFPWEHWARHSEPFHGTLGRGVLRKWRTRRILVVVCLSTGEFIRNRIDSTVVDRLLRLPHAPVV